MNLFALSGNLAQDAVVEVYGDRKVYRLKIAVNSNSSTDYFDVDYWACASNRLELKQGTGVEVTGRLKTNKFTPKGTNNIVKKIVPEATNLNVTKWPKRQQETDEPTETEF